MIGLDLYRFKNSVCQRGKKYKSWIIIMHIDKFQGNLIVESEKFYVDEK